MKFKSSASDFPMLWANYINEKNLDAVIGLYHNNFSLSPTFSPNIVNTKEGLKHYFSMLASRKGLEVEIDNNAISQQHIHADSYIISGVYSFKFEVDNALLAFPSRYSFVVDFAEEKPILHHHSSQVPGEAT